MAAYKIYSNKHIVSSYKPFRLIFGNRNKLKMSYHFIIIKANNILSSMSLQGTLAGFCSFHRKHIKNVFNFIHIVMTIINKTNE